MTQHLHHWLVVVRSPHSDSAVMVAQVNDSIVGIVTHHSQLSQMSLVKSHQSTNGHVHVTKVTVPSLVIVGVVNGGAVM